MATLATHMMSGTGANALKRYVGAILVEAFSTHIISAKSKGAGGYNFFNQFFRGF
jgi:hypothetical protein